MAATTFSLVDVVADQAKANVPRAVAEMRLQVDVDYELTTTRAGFDALEGDWNELFERAGRGDQMFMAFNWLWHWSRHYLDEGAELAIVTARRNGRLVLIWPMLIERVARLRQLGFMGAPVSQYGDVVMEDGAERMDLLDGAWAHLRSRCSFDLVRFAKVRDDALVMPFLQQLGFAATAREEAPFASIGTCATYEAFEERFSQKLRKNRRRQLRRLEERGPLDVQVLTGEQRARDGARLAMTLKRAWLNQKALVSIAFKDERIDGFFADAASSRERPCGVAISLLTSGGEGADVNVSVTCKGRRAIHILAYALKFEKIGVGNHHLDVNLRRAFDDGIEVYDFLAPRHAYKMEWADGVVGVSDYSVAISPLGRLYIDIYVARVREGIKRGLGKLPPGLRRLIAGAHRTV